MSKLKTTKQEIKELGREDFTIIDKLIGKVFSEVVQVKRDYDELHFISSEGTSYRFYHTEDCCESVYINDICGELSDLVGKPILMAEEVTRAATSEEVSEEGTWTFYKFATEKGYVTVRWLGESNGYYSEAVYFGELK